jgi:hypothetical protein
MCVLSAQFQAAWAVSFGALIAGPLLVSAACSLPSVCFSLLQLTNVAAGEARHVRLLIDEAGIPALITLLQRGDDKGKEQAVWGLGNIAGDSADFRDKVLNAGAMQPLLELCTDGASITVLRNCAWTLSNFCRGQKREVEGCRERRA